MCTVICLCRLTEERKRYQNADQPHSQRSASRRDRSSDACAESAAQPACQDGPVSRSRGQSRKGLPCLGLPQFLFWQCREAASPRSKPGKRRRAPTKNGRAIEANCSLLHDDGEDMNAFYDRYSFSFFHQTVGNATFFSGASTDVVAHEIGHGLLDAVRPDFFSVNFLEVGAFHEALATAWQSSPRSRSAKPGRNCSRLPRICRKKNFVEGTAEDLSEGIRRLQSNHNAATPRRAFNTSPVSASPYSAPQWRSGQTDQRGAQLRHDLYRLLLGPAGEPLCGVGADRGRAARRRPDGRTNSDCRRKKRGDHGTIPASRWVARWCWRISRLNSAANRDHIRNAFQAHGILLGPTRWLPRRSLWRARPEEGGARAGNAQRPGATLCRLAGRENARRRP